MYAVPPPEEVADRETWRGSSNGRGMQRSICCRWTSWPARRWRSPTARFGAGHPGVAAARLGAAEHGCELRLDLLYRNFPHTLVESPPMARWVQDLSCPHAPEGILHRR